MSESDFFGYLASFLVFATFYMQKTIPLRIAAIASNVAFIIYACSSSLTPILVLHSALLPLNLFRLAESWIIEPSRQESWSAPCSDTSSQVRVRPRSTSPWTDRSAA